MHGAGMSKKLFTNRVRVVFYLDAEDYAALEKHAGAVPVSAFVRNTLTAMLSQIKKIAPKK